MPTKSRRKTNKGYYLPYEDLEKYGLGSWLKENAGTVGSVAGMAIGTAIAPGVGTALGASIGGQLGSGVQQQDALSKQQAAQNQAVSLQNAQSAAQAQYQQAMANKNQQFAPVMRDGGKLIQVDDNFIDSVNKIKPFKNKLDSALLRKYKKIYPNANVSDSIASYVNSPNYSRRSIRSYKKRVDKYPGEVSLSENEKRLVLGKEFDNFVSKYDSLMNSNPEFFGINSTKGDVEGNVDTRKELWSVGNLMNVLPYDSSKETAIPALQKKAFGGTINYKGQTHDGPNGGVPVDNMGNPNSNNPSALVEKDEVGYNTPDGGTYIFSNKLMYGGNVSYAKEARKLQSKYGGNKRFRDNKPLDQITKFGYENDMKNLIQSQEAHKTILANSPEEIGGVPTASEGIYIKPSKRGTFTAWAKRHNMGVQEAARHVMTNKEDYSSSITKKANFARNASGWSRELGGNLNNIEFGLGGDLNNIEFKCGGSLPKYVIGGKFQPQIEDESYKLGTFQNESLDPGSENIYGNLFNNKTQAFESPTMSPTISNIGNTNKIDYATATGSAEITPGQSNKTYTPYSGMSAFSAFAPAAVSSLSNLYLANQVDKWQPRKLNLTRMQPQQINLENERAAMREQGSISRAMTRRGLMSSGASQGQLMANMGASDVAVQRALNEQLGQSYKQEGMYNVGARERADQLNAEQQLQEQAYNSQLDASKQAQKQQYMMNAITPLIGAAKDYYTSQQDAMKLQMQNPNEGLYVEKSRNPFRRRKILRMSNTDTRLSQ